MNRPLASIVTPVALAAAAGLTLWRTLDGATLAAGIVAGAVVGALAAVALTARPPGHRAPAVVVAMVRIGAVLAIFAVGLVVLARRPGIVTGFGTALTTFLSVDLPASGLRDLAVVPYLVVAPAATVAAWAARRNRTLLSLAAPLLALVAGTILAGPVGTPWWVPLVVVVAVGVHLMVVSRERYTDMSPLVGTSTAIKRQLPWWRPAVTGLAAVLIGGAALAVPLADPFDVRRFVRVDDTIVEDENPLAVAARLRQDPPSDAEGVDVTVAVDGSSPGRMRVAVLDRYTPEGWRQRAAFGITGEVLTPGPLDGVDRVDRSAVTSTVEVTPGPADTGLRGAPTAGSPLAVADPDGIRYAASAGVFLASDEAAPVSYRSVPRLDEAPPAGASAPFGVAADLYECPRSTIIDGVANVLTDGVASPVERLRRIEAWLKLRRIYDPAAPGGQTLGSVERFLSQEFARGNLEVFVTSFAVLARCADVPVRVVVGYPAPAADATTEFGAGDIEAWVETPLAGIGWAPVDPVPTPAEQQRQAELAAQPPPPPPPAEPVPEDVEVEPTVPGRGLSPVETAGLVLGALLVLVVLALLWAVAIRNRTLGRRRRIADPAAAVRFAWLSVVADVLDDGIVLGPHLTAKETARATTGRVPAPVTRLMSELSGLVDRARFDAASTTGEHAALAWALADAALDRLGPSWRVRLYPVRHPLRAVHRLRTTRGQPRRRTPWQGEVPDSALVTAAGEAPPVPGYEIEARIGTGSTSVVYRARDAADGRPVAIKVFEVDLSGKGSDRQRFAWEARVAQLVSGRPNLPEVFTSGITEDGRAYLVSKLYERGTLHRRVQRGGALSPGEVASAGRQLAMALETLHQHGILHGDVKPENVFIDDDGAMVLGDLGSAWLHADGGPAAALTPPYAAPEVWLGHAPTVASDVYSLGLTLMFAATARVPMAGSPPREDEILEAFGSDIAVGLLEIDPRRRPRSALAAAVQLGHEIDERSPAARPMTPLPTPTFALRSR